MHFDYKPRGVCARMINIDLDESRQTIESVNFVGGCPGNVQGVARLAENRPIDEVIAAVDGIRCGPKPTSCPDQLAQALKEIKKQMAAERA